MTDVEIIEKVLSSKKPSDLFTPTFDWVSTYKKYSRLIHPDVCKQPYADKAMATLNQYKEQLENGVQFTDEAGDKAVEYNNIAGVFIRKFEKGWVIYNRSENNVTISFPSDVTDAIRGYSAKSHIVNNMDGNIFKI